MSCKVEATRCPKVEVGTSAKKQLTRKWGLLEVPYVRASRSRIPTTLHVAKLLLQPLAFGPLHEAHPSLPLRQHSEGGGWRIHASHRGLFPRGWPLASSTVHGGRGEHYGRVREYLPSCNSTQKPSWATRSNRQSHRNQREQASKSSPRRPVLLSNICKYFPWIVQYPLRFYNVLRPNT